MYSEGMCVCVHNTICPNENFQCFLACHNNNSNNNSDNNNNQNQFIKLSTTEHDWINAWMNEHL